MAFQFIPRGFFVCLFVFCVLRLGLNKEIRMEHLETLRLTVSK